MSRRTAVATIAAATLGLAMLSAPVVPSSRAAAPVAPVGRLGFTDAQDQVDRISLSRGGGTTGSGPWAAAEETIVEDEAHHDGQASATVTWSPSLDLGHAFVSTRPTRAGGEDPDGEVWLVPPKLGDEQPDPIVITDDDAHQTHPVAWVDAPCSVYGGGHIDIVFASDRSGTWDLWVVHVNPVDEDGDRDCGSYTVSAPQQLTSGRGDDLWPNWIVDESGESRSLVFSSTRSDPMGDLYELDYGQGAELPLPGAALVQLTSGPAADSTPAARNAVANPVVCPGDPSGLPPRWLAFTRTDAANPRGGLAVLDLDDPGGGVVSLETPGASQPAWSPDGTSLAYRSTTDDPDGAIRIDLFERRCPPDLAVSALTLEPTNPVIGDTVALSVTVVNNSPLRTAGRLVIDFSGLLRPPGDCNGQRRCSLPVPMLDRGESRAFRWAVSGDEVVTAIAAGTQDVVASVEVTETEGDRTPQTDAVRDNDSRRVSLTVAPFTVDVELLPTSEELAPGIAIQPQVLEFGTAQTSLAATVTVRVLNPDPQHSVAVTVTVESADPLFSSAGLQRVSREGVTLPPRGGDLLRVPFPFAGARPPSGGTHQITVTASVEVTRPVVDLDVTNNSVSSQVTLVVPPPPSTAVPSPTEPIFNSIGQAAGRLLAGLRHLVRVASGSARAAAAPPAGSVVGVTWSPPAGGVGRVTALPLAGRAAVVQAAVPAPSKPPVADRLSLVRTPMVREGYGVAESMPSFSVLSNPDGQPYFPELTTLLVTARPAGSRLVDVRSDDGSGRRVLQEARYLSVGNPSYSPDGRFVAYERSRCDEALTTSAVTAPPGCGRVGVDIVVAKVDGSDSAVIYPAAAPRPIGALDTGPAWSADGTAIAFTRTLDEASDPSAIWVATGLDLDQDTVPATSLVARALRQLTRPSHAERVGDIDEFDDEATWSPDGKQIAYTRARFDTRNLGEPDEPEEIPASRRPTPGEHDSDIWVVEMASGDTRPLLAVEVGGDGDAGCAETSTRVCQEGDDRGADWSPNGSRIVYEHTGWLYLADPQQRDDLGPLTGPRSLVPGAGAPIYPDDPPANGSAGEQQARFFPDVDWAQEPAWSPDGAQIAFTGQPRGQPDQRRIDALTLPDRPADRRFRTVTDAPEPELQPDWQPLADLAITLTATPPTVTVGGPAALTARITNEGTGTALHAKTTVTLPAGLVVGTLPGGCVAGTPVSCALGAVPPGTTAQLTIAVRGPATGDFTAAGETSSRTVDPDTADNTARAVLRVADRPPPVTPSPVTPSPITPTPTPPPPVLAADVGVTLTVTPNPGYVGGPQTGVVTVRNVGPNSTDVTLTVTAPEGSGAPAGDVCFTGDGCPLGTVLAGAHVVRTVILTPTKALRGDVTARAATSVIDPQAANNTTAVRIQVLQPVLTLSPPIGAPGFVSAAIGENFPPGARVRLTWDPGLNATTRPLRVRRDGTFRTPVVVLVRDQLGPRTITATHVSGLMFDPVKAQFLVVPRTQQPPDFQGRG